VKVVLLVLCVVLSAPAWSSARFPVSPRAYVGLASLGAGGGFHSWTLIPDTDSMSFWDVNASLIEGMYFLSSGFGFGLRALDVTVCPKDTELHAVAVLLAAPMVSLVTNRGPYGFGYLSLAVMPYIPDMGGIEDVASSAASLDYAYVPVSPWPVEARARIGAMVLSWSDLTFAYHASVGVRVGLGYWFMDRPSEIRLRF
jgi:hypothetical protein